MDYPPLRIIVGLILVLVLTLSITMGAVLIENQSDNNLEAVCLKAGNPPEEC